MDITTRHLLTNYVVEITGRISNHTKIEVTVKPNSLVGISAPPLTVIEVNDWRDLVAAVDAAIEQVERHAGRRTRTHPKVTP